MKLSSIVFGLLFCSLPAASAVHAAPDPLSGTWAISTSGIALIGTPTNGSCSVSGTVPAGIYDINATFGEGTITILNMGISIGGTNCTSASFQGTGTYAIDDRGKGGFEANGVLSSAFTGRGAACAATSLTNVAFTIIGNIPQHSISITLNGLESGTYAEGPPAGPITCNAPIRALTAIGSGRKL
jgi:hypothetical protein